MRAGALDRTIEIERSWEVQNDLRQIVVQWEPLAALRAQLVQASTAEFIRGFGASSESAVVFRTRFMAGVTLADRVKYEGATFNIIEMKEIGRREGLELRCVRIGP